MKFPVGNRQPVRGVFRCILGQDNIQCAVRIQLEVGTVVDAVAVDGVIDEEIVVAVCGDRPEAAIKNLRIALKVEQIGLLSRQGIPVSVLIRLGIQGCLLYTSPSPRD